MKTLLKAFTYFLLGAVVIIGGYSLIDKPYQQLYPAPAVGGTVLPATTGVFYLAGSGITSSATSLTLTKLQISQNSYNIQDGDLGETMFLTIEPGSTSRQETISCETIGSNTGGNVTISDCTRGLSAISPYTASSTQRFSHSGSSKVIFSNPASFYNQILFKGNSETITGTYTYTSTAIPIFDSNPTLTDDKHFATKKYADDLAIAGSPDATLTVKGITEIATQTGMASTSIAGSGDTSAWLSLTSAYSTSTPSGDSYSALFLPVSENDGKLSQLWLDLTEAFTWTGAHIFSSTVDITGTATLTGTTAITGLFSSSATSTMATTTITKLIASADTANPIYLNGIDYAFPSTEGASSTIPYTDGSGNLLWLNPITKVDGTNSGTDMSSASATATRSISCPANTVAVGGGGYCTGNCAGSHLTGSYPSSATQWTVNFQCGGDIENYGSASFTARAYVLCCISQ